MTRPVETRPSAAHRWMKCAAAPQFSAAAGPQPSSDPAREGTCAAWVAEMVLTGRAEQCADLIGQRHENEWEVDSEMAAHAQDYVDLCRADGGDLWAEEHLTLGPRVAGTADSITLADGVLTVRDLKYGYRLVEPDSPQLIIYAGAVLKAPPEIIYVVRTEIYQPRGFHPRGPRRSIDWTPDKIRAECEKILARAEECHKPDPIATPGPHCLYCDGAVGCAAAQQTAAQSLAVAEMIGYRDRTPDELAQALHFYRWASETIQAAAKATEAEAEARAKRGERLPGWGIYPRLGNTRVTASPDAIRALTGCPGVKTVPMNVGDLRATGLTDEQLAAITDRPTIGHKLAPLDAATLAAQFTNPPTTPQE